MTFPDTRPIVHSDPEIMGGTVVFYGTRVPVQTMFDYLIAGDTLDEFLGSFPTVKRTQAKAALALANGHIQSQALLMPPGPYPPI